jgi:hypothetical protein
MNARPCALSPASPERIQTVEQVMGAGLFADHAAWLAMLKTGDIVLVRNGKLHFRAPVTDATPCFIKLDRLKFRRDNGWQTTRQRSKVYRMKLRLVRNEKEHAMRNLRWIERLTAEGRAAQLERDARDEFGADVLAKFKALPESEIVDNPHAALMKLARRERWRHPFHWFRFLKRASKHKPGPIESQLQRMKP